MKGNETRLAFEAAALSLQFRDCLIDMKNAPKDGEKLVLFGRIEKLLINACDRLRCARKDRSTRPRTNPQSETPWSVGRSFSGLKSGQATTAKANQGENQWTANSVTFFSSRINHF